MNTQKTLDGQTAGFIALVANSLPRSISSQQMSALKPIQLQVLLSILIEPNMIDLLPAITEHHHIGHSYAMPLITWIKVDDVNGGRGCRLEAVNTRASVLHLVYLPKFVAESYCNSVALISGLMPPCWFMYRDENGNNGAWYVNGSFVQDRPITMNAAVDNAIWWDTALVSPDLFFFCRAKNEELLAKELS